MIFGDNRSFVLSITLTELALLLFFLLLFTAVNEISKLQVQRDEAVEQRDEAVEDRDEVLEEQEAIRTRLAALAASADIDPVRLVALVEEAAELQNKLDSSEQEVEELSTRLAELEAVETGLEQLRAQIAETIEDDNEVYHLIRQAAQNIGKQGKLAELRESMVDLESDLANCSSQNLNCSRRLNEAGMGFPPCWADSQGKPEYIYGVTLRENTIEVRASWAAGRNNDVQDVTGATVLADRTMSLSEFSRLAQPILDWSKAQEPECRHFVTITDTPDMSKAAFKTNLLLVENYFYKYLTPDPR